MFTVLILLLSCYFHPVALQSPEIIRPPQNASVCIGGTVNFTCVVMFTNGTPGAATWFTNNGVNDASGEPNHSLTVDGVEPAAPANVTTVLTVTDVNINNNGSDYICVQGISVVSDSVILTVYGPPDSITTINISPNSVTSCGFTVQWSDSYSNPVCGSVWYIVTVSTGGLVINSTNTSLTEFTVTGLNASTSYTVSVTASNIAGSSDPMSKILMTDSNIGIPNASPNITVTPVTNTSFTVNWTSVDPSYNYTVIWTSLRTGVMSSRTFPGNVSSYTVTGLSDTDNYNVRVAAVDTCGVRSSDPVTVYDSPDFEYCISYNDGPQLQLRSNFTVELPRMSRRLTYFINYTTDTNSSSEVTYNLSESDFNFTLTAAVDIDPSVMTIEWLKLTLTSPYGSSSYNRSINQSTNPVTITTRSVSENSASLVCQLPCLSPDLTCTLLNVTANGMEVNVTSNISNISGSVYDYNYPTQVITLNELDSSTTYIYCATAVNEHDMLGTELVCGNFTTMPDDDEICVICIIIACVVGGAVAVALTVFVLLCWWCRLLPMCKHDAEKQLLRKHSGKVVPVNTEMTPFGQDQSNQTQTTIHFMEKTFEKETDALKCGVKTPADQIEDTIPGGLPSADDEPDVKMDENSEVKEELVSSGREEPQDLDESLTNLQHTEVTDKSPSSEQPTVASGDVDQPASNPSMQQQQPDMVNDQANESKANAENINCISEDTKGDEEPMSSPASTESDPVPNESHTVERSPSTPVNVDQPTPANVQSSVSHVCTVSGDQYAMVLSKELPKQPEQQLLSNYEYINETRRNDENAVVRAKETSVEAAKGSEKVASSPAKKKKFFSLGNSKKQRKDKKSRLKSPDSTAPDNGKEPEGNVENDPVPNEGHTVERSPSTPVNVDQPTPANVQSSVSHVCTVSGDQYAMVLSKELPKQPEQQLLSDYECINETRRNGENAVVRAKETSVEAAKGSEKVASSPAKKKKFFSLGNSKKQEKDKKSRLKSPDSTTPENGKEPEGNIENVPDVSEELTTQTRINNKSDSIGLYDEIRPPTPVLHLRTDSGVNYALPSPRGASVRHIHTGSGAQYALPSPGTSRKMTDQQQQLPQQQLEPEVDKSKKTTE